MINKQYFLLKAWLFLPAILFYSCTPKAEIAENEGDQIESDEGIINCYESISPNSNQRSTSHEYIVFWNNNGIITGKGSGYDEGEPLWEFDLNGLQVNDSLIEVKVNYTQEGTVPFTSTEQWILDARDENLRLKNAVPRHPGVSSYFKVEPVDIPSGFQQLLEK